MGKIGDYIHYYPSRYAAMGIKREGRESGTAGVVSSIDIYNEQKNIMLDKFKSMKEQKYIEEMEARLNMFFSNIDKKDNNNDKKAMEVVVELLEEEFGESVIKGMNRQTGNVVAMERAGMKEFLKEVENRHGKLVESAISSSNTYLRSLYDRLTLVEAALDTFLANDPKKERLEKLLAIEYKMINDILTDRQAKYNEVQRLKGREINPSIILKWKDIVANGRLVKGKKKGELEGYNAVTLMNYLIKESGIFTVANASRIKGQFFENSVAAALAITGKKSKKEIRKALTQSVRNFDKDNKKNSTIDFGTFFSNDIPFSQISSMVSGYSAQGNNLLVSNIASDGKLDVIVEWGGEPKRISAKNYNLSTNKGVSLVTGANLLYMLQDEKSDFVNHYFNLIGIAKTPSFDINYYRKEAYGAVALTILYKAMTGDTYGREDDMADIFIVKDNTKTDNSVRVYDMGSILRKVGNNMNKLDDYIRITYGTGEKGGSSHNLKDLTVANRWMGNKRTARSDQLAGVRIANFLVNVMKVKLHASLKEQSLSQF